MSQEKVAKYKEQKANRKETMKKQKRAKVLRNSIMGIVFVAVIGWIGYSAVDFYINNQPRQTVEVDYGAVDTYIEALSKEDSEEVKEDSEEVKEDSEDSEDSKEEAKDDTEAESETK